MCHLQCQWNTFFWQPVRRRVCVLRDTCAKEVRENVFQALILLPVLCMLCMLVFKRLLSSCSCQA